MRPLIVPPCPQCANEDVSLMARVRLLTAFGECEAVRCERCGHVTPVLD